MSSAHDAALSFLLAQQTQESIQINREAVVTKVTVSMSPAPSKKLAKKNEPAPIREKSGTPGMVMPDRGTLNAKDFLLAMRNAGRRVNAETGATYIDQREVRNDQIKAIHSFMYQETKAGKVYIGYDPKGSFGSQDTAARALAQRELRGPVKVSEVAKPSLSAGGYVAGMPDHNARKLADLQGREVAAVDAMLAHEKDSRDVGRSASDRELSQGLAEVERERLAQIRADIAALL